MEPCSKIKDRPINTIIDTKWSRIILKGLACSENNTQADSYYQRNNRTFTVRC